VSEIASAEEDEQVEEEEEAGESVNTRQPAVAALEAYVMCGRSEFVPRAWPKQGRKIRLCLPGIWRPAGSYSRR